MLKNYLLVAWRNFSKSKIISFINLSGLVLGLTFSLIILFWVEDEQRFDAFHNNSSRIFNVYEVAYADGKAEYDNSTPGLLSEELKKRLPEVEHASVWARNRENTFQFGDKVLKQTGQYANEDFLKIFNFPLLAGNLPAALNSPNGIAISERMAGLFFGNTANAIGKTLRCNDRDNLTVSAVFTNVPVNSSLQFDYLINWPLFLQQNRWATNFGNTSPFTTVLLREGADPSAFREKIKDFLDKYDNVEGPGYQVQLHMQRFDEAYLHSTFKDGVPAGGRIEYVRLFSIVAVFILLIACINFMNLSTARAFKRAREIGVRKIVGASRRILIGQFLTEATSLAFASVIGALLLIYFILPVFNSLTGKQIALPLNDLQFWIKITGIALSTGLIAGIYPALNISSFAPIKAIKGKLKIGTDAVMFKKGLVVFQFTLSILLIVGTIVISKQVTFIQTKNIGFNRENLVYIPLEGALSGKYQLFAAEARKIDGVKDITHVSNSPTDIGMFTTSVEWSGKDPSSKPSFAYASVGYDFIKTVKAQMLMGRDFSRDFASDSAGYIVNETALKRIGYQQPVNQPITFQERPGRIVGVVKDFHFASLHQQIQPLIVYLDNKNVYGQILVRTAAGQTHPAMQGLEKLCRQLNPSFPFTFQFADDDYLQFYQSERVVGVLSKYFTILAIVISCMGLLGLAIFSAEQRTKEIGIRKVLGASVASVFTLLSKEFLQLILISIVIATPIAWWAMTDWLNSFEYRISIHWWMFATAGLSAIVVTLLTISFQLLKTAFANPVRSLRAE